MKKIFYIVLWGYISLITCSEQRNLDILHPNLIQNRKQYLQKLHNQTYELCYEDCIPTVSALAQLLQLRIRIYQERYIPIISQLQEYYEIHPSAGILNQFMLREKKFQSFADRMSYFNEKLLGLHKELLPAIKEAHAAEKAKQKSKEI